MSRWIAACRAKIAVRLWLVRAIVRFRRRSLIGEILSLQLAALVLIGALAFGGVWWASTFVDDYAELSFVRNYSIVAGVLVLLTAVSWLIYRRTLRPLAALQAPLRQLAHGKTDVSIATTGHREIAAIATTLNATASALSERDQKLTQIAHRDAVTGLLNRTALDALLADEIRWAADTGRSSAVLFLDLDHFKHVNDSLSHVVGDRLLRLTGQRLQEGLRPGDAITRFGGDEFVILLRDVSQKEAAAMCGDNIRRIQGESFAEDGRSLNIRCSIGATMIRGSKINPDTALSRADAACHQSKAEGRNQFRFYKPSSKESTEMAADAGWGQKIQSALKQNRFVLHYQPIVKVRTRATAYHEVLLRMLDDDDELVFPAEFLPAAARLGLTVDIDHWVIRHSLRSLATVRHEHTDERFTLNVSGSTFDRADFFALLEAELRASHVPLDAIVIEITEQTAMRNIEGAAARMVDLAERGCRFAIDDFGSGYSSYSYLKELPVAFVKIDGSFVVNLTDDDVDQKIVAAIAQVAAATHCETIAEHVGNYETLRLLDGLGVAYAQGYYLGKPSAEVTAAEPAARRPVAARASRRAGTRQHHASA